jgi:hypothetical protein
VPQIVHGSAPQHTTQTCWNSCGARAPLPTLQAYTKTAHFAVSQPKLNNIAVLQSQSTGASQLNCTFPLLSGIQCYLRFARPHSSERDDPQPAQTPHVAAHSKLSAMPERPKKPHMMQLRAACRQHKLLHIIGQRLVNSTCMLGKRLQHDARELGEEDVRQPHS